MSNRSTLKTFFATAARPTQAQFQDFIDSTVSLAESNPGNIVLTGGVVVGNTNVPAVPGAIRWSGTVFEFHNGAGFQALSFGGGIANPLTIGTAMVGDIPTLSTMSGFGHNSRFNRDDCGFTQTSGGTTGINSPATGKIELKNASSPAVAEADLTIQGHNVSIRNVLTVKTQVVIGTPAASPVPPAITPASALLAVYGEAVKLSGNVWTTMSDVRTKKDISTFSEGLDELIKVNCVRFKYKNMEGVEGCDKEQVGILAHEMRKVFPYMIGETKVKLSPDDDSETELLTFNGSALQFVVINAIKELNERLHKLEKSIINTND